MHHAQVWKEKCVPPIRVKLTEQLLCDHPPHDPQGPEGWSSSQLYKTRKTSVEEYFTFMSMYDEINICSNSRVLKMTTTDGF